MYERYGPSDQVFVDREEYLEWMNKALERCKEKSVVLHLRGEDAPIIRIATSLTSDSSLDNGAFLFFLKYPI